MYVYEPCVSIQLNIFKVHHFKAIIPVINNLIVQVKSLYYEIMQKTDAINVTYRNMKSSIYTVQIYYYYWIYIRNVVFLIYFKK